MIGLKEVTRKYSLVQPTPRRYMKLFYFTSTTCKACHSFEPVVKDLCQKYGLDFYHLDVMKDVKEVCKYGILSLPTTIILDSEGERKRFIGKTSELQQWLGLNLGPLARPSCPA